MEASHLITEIKGVGVKTTALFSKLHIETIKDLISYFPRGYDHYEEALPVGELCTGKVQSVRACIVGTPSMVRAKGMVITHAQAGDASGRMKLTWISPIWNSRVCFHRAIMKPLPGHGSPNMR